jgi:SAM-dependent methyltransferase
MPLAKNVQDAFNVYDLLAHEYYSATHRTSRNFDEASSRYLMKWQQSIIGNLFVELGSGRGRANEFLGVDTSKLVHVDSSEPMLSIEPREDCIVRIISDARTTPFLSSTFDGAFAFLFDPFNEPVFYEEVYRILRKGGTFIGTLPACTWGISLRRKLGISVDSTRFITQQGKTVSAPSYLIGNVEIESRLKRAGFDDIEVSEAKLPSDVTDISPDVRVSADELGVPIFDLPLVQVFRARK